VESRSAVGRIARAGVPISPTGFPIQAQASGVRAPRGDAAVRSPWDDFDRTPGTTVPPFLQLLDAPLIHGLGCSSTRKPGALVESVTDHPQLPKAAVGAIRDPEERGSCQARFSLWELRSKKPPVGRLDVAMAKPETQPFPPRAFRWPGNPQPAPMLAVAETGTSPVQSRPFDRLAGAPELAAKPLRLAHGRSASSRPTADGDGFL